MSNKTITERLTNRMRSVIRKAEDFEQAYNDYLPALTQDIDTFGNVSRALGELYQVSRQAYSEAAAAASHLAEYNPAEITGDLANVATITANLDIFFQSNPELLASIMKDINRGIIKAAAEHMASGTMEKWIEELTLVLEQRSNEH